MKILLAISMFCLTTMCIGVIVELYNIADTHICLSELPEDGNSEKDTSENTEDDSEKDSFDLLEHIGPTTSQVLSNGYSSLINTWNYLEIPNPPPKSC